MVLRVAQPPKAVGAAVDEGWINRVFVRRDDETSLTTASSSWAAPRSGPRFGGGGASRSTMDHGAAAADLPRRAVLALRAAKKIGQHSAHSALGDLLAESARPTWHQTSPPSRLECEEIPSADRYRSSASSTWRHRKLLDPSAGPRCPSSASALRRLAQKGLDLDAAGNRAAAWWTCRTPVNLYRG